MKVFILHNSENEYKRRELFILTRPFYKDGTWADEDVLKKEWGLNPDNFQLTNKIEQTDIVLIPKSINYYFDNKKEEELLQLNLLCKKHAIKAYGYIGGDYGYEFTDFSNIVYFRFGGFKSQLTNNNKGFPVGLSDHFQIIFNQETIAPSLKKEIPTIGFCGHASLSRLKKVRESFFLFVENVKRFSKKPNRKDYEPIFAATYQRAKLLKLLEKSKLIQTNFIYRSKYRAGIKNEMDAKKTTLEYYNNIRNSDYILCLRGGGNFSVRFYETLMMGKIPVFVNTDCLLPFENDIKWKNHVVWIEWNDRKNIAKKIIEFHNKMTNEEFINLQINNRNLWKETFSINGIFQMIKNDF